MYGAALWDLADTMPEGTREEKDAKIPVMTKVVTGFTKMMVEARKAGDDSTKEVAAENMRRATTILQALKPCFLRRNSRICACERTCISK